MLQKPKLSKPIIGGSLDDWGRILNETIDTMDTFNSKIVIDSSTQDQELARLDRDKIDKSDLNEFVKNVVDNYVEENTKPQLNEYVDTVNKPELDRYTETKKSELNNLTDTKKEELNAHEKLKEKEITSFVEVKKEELVQYVDTVSKVEINSHTNKKKQEIDAFTEEQKVELDGHEKLKEGQLDSYEKEKESQLDSHVETVNKVELQNYVNTKKEDINIFTEAQKTELDEHEKVKEGEINTHVSNKIGEINSHVESKKVEINDFTEEQKVELDAYEKVKEGQLESFKNEKKVEITSHTDSEIERINATGIDGKQDKVDNTLETKNKKVVGAINELLNEKENLITRSNAINSESTTDVATSKAVNDLRLEVEKKTVNVGNGLSTTGVSDSGQTISIIPKNESILVDNNSIWVNIVNDFTTGGVNKVASAESIKVLKQLIDTLGGGGATKLLRASEALGEYDYIGDLPSGGISITVGARLFNPTLYLDGIRLEENRYSVEFETGLITLNEPYANYNVVWVVEDQMPYHVTFCFPTMNLLLASEDIKSRIKLGNVIKILGTSDEDDGGHYLVKCENTAKLNAVQIAEGKYLNEIPNTKIKTLTENINNLNLNKLGKTEKASDSELLDGHDSSYFARQSDMISAQTQIAQNKSDILLKANLTNQEGVSNFGYNQRSKIIPNIISQVVSAGDANTQNNTIAIHMVNGWDSTMFKFDVNIYSYNSKLNSKVTLFGYLYSNTNSIVNCGCHISGYNSEKINCYWTRHPDTGNPLFYITMDKPLDYGSCSITNLVGGLSAGSPIFGIYYIIGYAGEKIERALEFNTKNCPIEKGDISWVKLANGLIIQWGTITIPNNTSPVKIKLPVTYSTGTSYVSLCSTIKNIGDVYKEPFSRAICNVDNANIEIASAYNGSSGARWLTIGY